MATQHRYTYRDAGGMLWRFEGSRPVSQLADKVVSEVLAEKHKRKTRQRKKGK